MNDFNDSLENLHDVPENDPLLEEAFSRLQQWEPPLESRVRNRLAVTAELERLRTSAQKQSLPWWRRTIAVPVPVAAGLAALAAILLLAVFRAQSEASIAPPAAANQSMQSTQHTSAEGAVAIDHSATSSPVMQSFETETYLCGIGRLKLETGYRIQEENQ
ncbi:MAG TPA: hypothetical protein VFE46_15570 [Pirellulales bacterium]|nr:hypothetical protein [Pirellulales bacterium]